MPIIIPFQSKQKSRSYSFEVMNREKRQFIHEYCEHFGCESVAYDQEPKRNVVATAQKVKVRPNPNCEWDKFVVLLYGQNFSILLLYRLGYQVWACWN